MVRAFLVAILSLVSTRCVAPPDPIETSVLPIVGGYYEPGYPAVGALKSNGMGFCTGTLISPGSVLTAAHCMQGASVSGITFATGSDYMYPDEELLVSSYIVHPDYAYNYGADLAVLVLTGTSAHDPMRYLRDGMDESFIGRRVRLVGFGMTNVWSRQTQTYKNSVSLPVTQIPRADEFYHGQFRYEELWSGKSTCYGDSGGPAIMVIDGKEFVVGVTSHGTMYCDGFGYSTRTDMFSEFIDSLVSNF